MTMHRCYGCHTTLTDVRADKAAATYERLKSFLEYIRSGCCYFPMRPNKGSCDMWPLHHWDGPGTFPAVLKWNPHATNRPTFTQFCRAAGWNPIEQE